MADNVFAQFARVMLTPLGDDNAARIAGATNLLAHQAAGTGVDAQTAFEQGRKEFKQDLRQTRLEHPFGAFGAEMAGTAALAGLGGTAAKALRLGALLNALEKPFVRGSAYPKRSRQQWQADLQYGKEQFKWLQKHGLHRQGEDDPAILHRSWNKIKQGNNPQTYDAIRDAPSIYANGTKMSYPETNSAKHPTNMSYDYYVQPLSFPRQNRTGVVNIANDKVIGRYLKNIMGNLEDYIKKHPEFLEKNPDFLERLDAIKKAGPPPKGR